MKTKNEIIKDIISGIKDTVFPNICVCGKWGKPLCDNCKLTLIPYRTEFCPICRKISEEGRVCKSCRGQSYLTGLLVFGKHQGLLKELIWRYKYEANKDLYLVLSEKLLDAYGDFVVKKKFVVTFAPISEERMSWRGYNQSKLLAEEVCKKTDLRLVDLLTRKAGGSPQVGLKRKDRILNVKDTILLKNNHSYKGRVIIIDDVYTTGATLEECAKMLRQAGFREVWGMVLSRE